MTKTNDRFTVFLTQELGDKLREMAAAEGLAPGQVIRSILVKKLNESTAPAK